MLSPLALTVSLAVQKTTAERLATLRKASAAKVTRRPCQREELTTALPVFPDVLSRVRFEGERKEDGRGREGGNATAAAERRRRVGEGRDGLKGGWGARRADAPARGTRAALRLPGPARLSTTLPFSYMLSLIFALGIPDVYVR